ncbi:hypothetical protein N7468_005113 [Penicillium chermesinum]|uniref:SH3 domain-containing protein n=1 Tax=Penicillium chermesinum TaxID=63820 RepID=A0A9W9NYP3_9EURO|nr:uncharacterized protein N7468_005113 [Penicillium chermesinum]KAJ5232157.1 hypothetical protein N7468_005113 [Penicillium chermesinum]
MTSPTASPDMPDTDNLAVLPPINTDSSVKSPPGAKNRLSTYSNVSFASQSRSRPGSHVFPIFHSSLPYALVRDFAYPPIHPLHYGPPPQPSGDTTPASEYRRLSDPPPSWDTSRGPWVAGPWNTESTPPQGHQQLPAMSFGDGPHTWLNCKRHNECPPEGHSDRGTLVSINADGSETYYVNGSDGSENGPGGEYVTYPAHEGRYSHYVAQQGYAPDVGLQSPDGLSGEDRYANDYQFAVGCPDEEMHGKAVALFDFTREHENELPLTEGQVIYVSYRHGEGWLVAEDPKTGENGLVPEQFVRLLRDIEGGLTSLNGEELHADSTDTSTSMDMTDDDRIPTPTQSGPIGTSGAAQEDKTEESAKVDDANVVAGTTDKP